MIQKIGIVSCYFGKFPWYFTYFLHSCKFNPTVDFIIITDSEEVFKNKPDNVYFIKRQLKEIENLATKRLGFKVSIPYPYKICDIKPAYGFLFSDLLKKYDFWGHADLDIIYGNIREFMTEKLLFEFEIISMRHDYITGSCALFKNSNKINTLFMQSKDYKKVFSHSEHFSFDECNFLWDPLEKGKSILEIQSEIESMTHVVKRLDKMHVIKAYFDFIIVEGTPGHVKWDKGRIIYKNRFEGMFYNLVRFKTKCKKHSIFKKMPTTFYFSPTAIYKK
jgi:hypothetical protein